MKPVTIHTGFSFILKFILLIEAIVAVWEQQWFTAFITIGIIVVALTPFIMAKSIKVFLPPEFEVFAISFVFSSLFLGEVRGYYTRFWWWDILLHTSSGLLLGIIGFLLVHILNETEEIDLHMKPGFVAFLLSYSQSVSALFGKSLNLPWIACF